MHKFLSNKISIGLVIAACTGASLTQAQTISEGWALGAGLTYPRYLSTNITTQNLDYGGYILGQRIFSEHISIRARGAFSHLEGQWINIVGVPVQEKTDLATLDLGMLYYFVPCEIFSPYISYGIGGNYKNLSQKQSAEVKSNTFGTQVHLGTGAEFKFTPKFSVVGEFGYYRTNNSDLDGTIVPTEMNGRDSYIVLSAGVKYLIGKHTISSQCTQCSAPTANEKIDYDRFEKFVVKHIPQQIEKVVVTERVKVVEVDNCIIPLSKNRLALVGVNFAFDDSELLPESFTVLDRAAKLLLAKPAALIEVEGYTDNTGSLAYNQELSLKRAERVKSYLVFKGIPEKRIATVGYGKNNPVEDNETADGREMNRRIVFRVIDQP